jgi:hypothetical protein
LKAGRPREGNPSSARFNARTFMDEVLYNDVSNAVVLIKRRTATNGEEW